MFVLEHFGLTDAGKVRQNNEDSLLLGEGRDDTLFAVADGIGGFEAGEVASSITVDALKEMEPGAPFEAALGEANRRVLAAARGDEKLSGMGTTIVALRFYGADEEAVAEVAHVGDSRAYLLRGGELRALTEDHSLVAELVRSGDLTRAQASSHPQKNLITRALGAEEEVEADIAVLPVETGDRFLLCSDGLSDMVPEERIGEILAETPGNTETAVRRLVSAALDAGGNDNVTAVVIDVKQRRPPEPAAKHGGTQEMPVVAPPGGERAPGENAGGAKAATGKGRSGRIIRALALVLIVLIAATPVYLWGSSRYFLGFEGSEVVAYRGLPYAPLGIELNEEWRRTGIREGEIEEIYRSSIEDHRLYTRDQVQHVIRDLEG
jgi:serine/threonine protein phosphatase PrpC